MLSNMSFDLPPFKVSAYHLDKYLREKLPYYDFISIDQSIDIYIKKETVEQEDIEIVDVYMDSLTSEGEEYKFKYRKAFHAAYETCLHRCRSTRFEQLLDYEKKVITGEVLTSEDEKRLMNYYGSEEFYVG